jgi:uncharacterized protein YgiM (DUF1202 family)
MHPALIPVAGAAVVIGGGIAWLRNRNKKKIVVKPPVKKPSDFQKAVEAKGVSLTPGVPSTGIPVPTTQTPSVEVALQKAVAAVTTQAATDVMTGAALGAMGVVVTQKDPLLVRNAPGVGAPVVAQMPRGSAVRVVGEDGDWYKVLYGTIAGYASKKYISTDANPIAAQVIEAVNTSATDAMTGAAIGAMGTIVTQTDPLTLRASPGGSVIGSIPKGTVVQILGSSPDGKWYQVLYKGMKGYSSKQYISVA